MNTKTGIRFWDYLTPRGRNKIKQIRLDNAVQLFVNAIKLHIGERATLLGQELVLLDKCGEVDYLKQRVRLAITAVRRKNWRVELIFDKRSSRFVVGGVIYGSYAPYRETWYSLKQEVIVVGLTTDGKLNFVKSGLRQSEPKNFDVWRREFLASPTLVTDLPEQTRLILEAVSLLSFVNSTQSLRSIFCF